MEFKGSDQGGNDDSGEDRNGKVGDESGSEEQDQDHGQAGGDRHPLGTDTKLVCNPGS